MNGSHYGRSALGLCATVALLSGCGGLQPPMGAPDAMQQNAGIAAPESAAAARTIAHRIVPTSSSYQLLYSFGGGSDGATPYAGLINMHGMLYGTTLGGGANGNGTVFSVTTTGKEKVLYSFGGGSADGAAPYAGLINVNGTLYGTTFYGGAHGYGTYPAGTVFSVTRSGAEKVLYSFGGSSADAFGPYADLINVNGTLYGTTYDGGPYYLGTVFSITTTGTEKVLHGFGYGYDGDQPLAGLINVKGVLYGTTATGGRHYAGTVFSVTTTGQEKTLYSFCSKHKCADGSSPEAGLINVNGTLYGTTDYGGGTAQCGRIGCGTVFSVTTTGGEKVLYTFGSRSADGANPYAALINVNGTLYGTTTGGGAYGAGTVFAFTP